MTILVSRKGAVNCIEKSLFDNHIIIEINVKIG